MSGGTEYPKEILSGGTHLGGARFTTTPSLLNPRGGRTRSRVTHIMPSQQKVSHSVAVLF